MPDEKAPLFLTVVCVQGMVRRNNHLKMARYHQHLHELLEMDLSPLDYMMKMFPEFKEREQMRKVSILVPVSVQIKLFLLAFYFCFLIGYVVPILLIFALQVIGRYGVTGKAQTAPIKQLSDGQKCRVVFAWLSWQVCYQSRDTPHFIFFISPPPPSIDFNISF